MKNTVLTVIFSLISTICVFFTLVYPAWFQQHYKRDGHDVFQGLGIFAFYSTEAIESPFYASETTLQYAEFCKSDFPIPNYMLGDGDDFRTALCGKSMQAIQFTTAIAAGTSVLSLLAAIFAVFNPSAGYAEKIVSFCTLVGSLLLAVSLIIWGSAIQRRLYTIDSINSAYTTCEADNTDWSCWFYGYSFWVCLAAVILLSITGYLSSAGRAEKIRYFRKEYERDLHMAMQASLQQPGTAPSTTTFHGQQTPPHLQNAQLPQVQSNPDAFYPVSQNSNQYHPSQAYAQYEQQSRQQYQPQQLQTSYQSQSQSQPPPSYHSQSQPPPSYHSQSQPPPSYQSQSQPPPKQPFQPTSQGAYYPTMQAERKNHSLLGRTTSGVVL